MAKRTTLALLTSVLVAIGAFVYLSPAPPTAEARDAAARAATVASANASATYGATPSGTTNSAPRAGSGKRKARPERSRPRAKDRLDGTAAAQPAKTTTNGTKVKLVKAPSSTGTAAAAAPAAPRDPVCADFTWQQDAQAAYVRNLADPYALDGPSGPNNDDGIACSLLPVDPARPASTPAGEKPPPPPQPEPMPIAPTMAELLTPELSYFGVSTPQTPYDFKEFQIFAGAARKLPNLNEFFVGWDHEFPRDQVIALWRRNALPIVSWEPRPTVQAVGPDSDNTASAGYKLASIIDGSHDEYIDRFANDVKNLGLPVAIRFAHEMNGNWFPWSEDTNGNKKGEYVKAWRHVHDRFTELGVTNAIWIWSPNVVTARPSVRLAQFYPGDDYVDWLGIVGYYRRVYLDEHGQAKPPTFDNTYIDTLVEIRKVASKPIVITEAGATEVGGNKPAWIKSFFEGLAANPDIIGFVWFDHSVNGTDWRIESSSAATDAFATGIADPRFGQGKVYTPR